MQGFLKCSSVFSTVFFHRFFSRAFEKFLKSYTRLSKGSELAFNKVFKKFSQGFERDVRKFFEKFRIRRYITQTTHQHVPCMMCMLHAVVRIQ